MAQSRSSSIEQTKPRLLLRDQDPNLGDRCRPEAAAAQVMILVDLPDITSRSVIPDPSRKAASPRPTPHGSGMPPILDFEVAAIAR